MFQIINVFQRNNLLTMFHVVDNYTIYLAGQRSILLGLIIKYYAKSEVFAFDEQISKFRVIMHTV